jgi:site-specific DNA recombinase
MSGVVGYIRVSTIGQADEGVSLDAQEEKIKMWASLYDSHLLDVHKDAGVSGKAAGNRPGLEAAVAQACKNHARLVVYSLSRLGRSASDIFAISQRLSKAKADLVSVTEHIDTNTAAGKMVFRMLAVLSEFERDSVSERTRSAMDYKRAQGKRISRYLPFGYDLAEDNETLVPNRKELYTVKTILQMRDDGHTLQEICDDLKRRHRLNKSGKPVWYPSVVRGIIQRAKQQGEQKNGKKTA